MCGICGILRLNDRAEPIEPASLLKMRDRMAYRGPDDAGLYVDEWIGLGSRRLSIVDLSARGHMPMSTPDGRYTIVHNGEVYNFAELRQELVARGICFRSQTDTEVLLHLYIQCGPEMLQRCNGMFAFAIWDAQERRLFLARDRFGVKPLYFSMHHDQLFWGSEEKVLFAAGLAARFDETVWPELLCFRYVSGERTPYQNVKRLLPGHYLIVEDGQIRTRRWWSMQDALYQEPASKEAAWADKGLELFQDSIRLRRISDVPVGVLLSGGIDSGGIASVMAEQAGQGVESFTVRFSEQAYDEGALARQVAGRWGLKYHDLFVRPEQIPALLQEATYLLDEPIVHGNDLHLLAISRMARPLVTVLLSGEGADEIFGGYVRYRFFLYDSYFHYLGPIIRKLQPWMPLQGRSLKTLELLSLPDPLQRLIYNSAEVFPSTARLSQPPEELYPFRWNLALHARQAYPSGARQAMDYEQQTYLQSVLDRNDRMTMGASIECREPYLDMHLVEWAARLPQNALFQNGKGKAILRQALSRYLPADVLRHKKWGFGVPWQQYFRNVPTLNAWIEGLHRQPVFESLPQGKIWVSEVTSQFLSGSDSVMPELRQFVMISLWHSLWIEGKTEPLAELTPSQQEAWT